MKTHKQEQSKSHKATQKQNLLCTCFSLSQLTLHLFVLLLSLLYFNQISFSAVTVTPATNGSNLCSGVYYTLGNIIITEGTATDIALSQTNVTLILTAPSGYEFNLSTGSVSFAGGGDITAASISVIPATITITFSTNGMPSAADQLTISGIQVTASIPSPPASSGNIFRTAASPGTASITGITNNVTNFGTLSQSTAMIYVSGTVTQNNISGVATNSTNNEIIGIQIVTCGSTSPMSATSFTLNTSGTDNPALDVSNAKVWFTATSSIFATTTQFGSLVAAPNGTFTITGTQTLSEGTNYFWLTYDVLSGATNGNNIDAQCNSLIVGGSSKTPSNSAPSGVRGIGNMTYLSSTCVQVTSLIGGNATNNEILQIQVVTKGGLSPLSATSFTVNGNGTTFTVTDKIQNAKIFYTGTSDKFATTTQVGATVAAPGASNFNITGSQVLATGTNYFWLSFDTKIYGAPNIVVGDFIDGECSSITVGGTPQTPTVTVPTGNRKVGVKWLGVTNTDWNTATNWSSGTVPNTSTTDVVIPGGTPNQPITNADIAVRDLYVMSGAILDVGGQISPQKTLNISGNLVIEGNMYSHIISGSGALGVQLIGVANTLKGSATGCGFQIQFAGSGNYTLSGDFTCPDFAVTGTLNLDKFKLTNEDTLYNPPQSFTFSGFTITTGGIVNQNTGTLEIQKLNSLTNGTFNSQTGTTIFNINSNFTIPALTYYNLKVKSYSSTATISTSTFVAGYFETFDAGTTTTSALTILGSFTIGSGTTFIAGVNLILIYGDFFNNGTFTPSTSAIKFSGTGGFVVQNIGGTSTTTFYTLIINNSFPYSGVTLQQNTNVSNSIDLVNSPLNLNQKTLTVTNAATSAITRTDGYILSETNAANNTSILQWNIGATTGAHIFPFGTTSGDYIPVTFNNSGSVGNISISTRPTTANDNLPWATGVSSMTGTGTNITTAADRWWDITSSVASPLPSVDLTLSYLGGENATTTSPTDTRGVQRWNGTSWDDGKGGANGSVTTSGNAGVTSGVGTVAITGLTNFSSPYVVVRAAAPMGDIVIQNFYWVGGNGNWNDAAHWSTTSGGAGGAGIPDINTNVYIDNNSGTVTITMPAGTWYTKNFTMSGAGAKSPIVGQGSLLPRP